MLKKITDVPASDLVKMINAGLIRDIHRVIWKGKISEDNVIFVATNDSLVDMIQDTTEPTDMFELWGNLQEDSPLLG